MPSLSLRIEPLPGDTTGAVFSHSATFVLAVPNLHRHLQHAAHDLLRQILQVDIIVVFVLLVESDAVDRLAHQNSDMCCLCTFTSILI
eukprot:7454849-Heterocapsa_arctica.AAC.1